MVRKFVCIALLLHLLCAAALAATVLAADNAAQTLGAAGLVEPSSIDNSLVLDIRYATENNFTGKRVYPSARCFLRTDVAKRLLSVQENLRGQGLGLKIYDCYRPFSVQEAFWAIMPDERYVGKPARENGVIVKSSRHNRGAAVDVTLVDAQGQELPMPTGYDDFSDKAHRNSLAASAEARRNSQALERAMQTQGFDPLPTEWWHFDGPGWQDYEPLDLPLPASR